MAEALRCAKCQMDAEGVRGGRGQRPGITLLYERATSVMMEQLESPLALLLRGKACGLYFISRKSCPRSKPEETRRQSSEQTAVSRGGQCAVERSDDFPLSNLVGACQPPASLAASIRPDRQPPSRTGAVNTDAVNPAKSSWLSFSCPFHTRQHSGTLRSRLSRRTPARDRCFEFVAVLLKSRSVRSIECRQCEPRTAEPDRESSSGARPRLSDVALTRRGTAARLNGAYV